MGRSSPTDPFVADYTHSLPAASTVLPSLAQPGGSRLFVEAGGDEPLGAWVVTPAP